MPDGDASRSWPIDIPADVAIWLHGFIALTGLLLVAGLLALRLTGRRPSLPLTALFLLFALQALANIAYQQASPAWMPQLGWLIQLLELRAIVGFIFGPLALLYVREFLDPAWRPQPLDALHAVPALVMGATLYLWPEWEINVYAYASAAALVIYAGLAWRIVAASGYLRQGDGDRRVWLWMSAALFAMLLGVNAVATNFNCRPISDPMVRLYQAGLLTGIIALVYTFITAGLWRSFVLFPAETPRSAIAAPASRMRADPALAGQFTALMEEEALWREPDLTLGRIAGRLSVSPRRLSLAVRDALGMAVSDWINARRVEAVQRTLRADPHTGRSLLDLAFEAGFSSKPSFNRAFSKFTGMTPSAYRDEVRG